MISFYFGIDATTNHTDFAFVFVVETIDGVSGILMGSLAFESSGSDLDGLEFLGKLEIRGMDMDRKLHKELWGGGAFISGKSPDFSRRHHADLNRCQSESAETLSKILSSI